MKHLILAAMIIAGPAHAAQPTLRVCTGEPGLRYFKTGVAIGEQLRGVATVDVKQSHGSIDNLRAMANGDCDGALVQSDAYMVYQATTPNASLKMEDVGPIYQEYAQLLCNRDSGVGRVSNLKDGHAKVAIGPAGSGSATTWYAMADKNNAYNKVPTVPLDSALALTRVINGHDAQCLFVVSGLNTDFMKKANDLGRGKLVLVPFDDGAFGKIADSNGKAVYDYVSIPGGTYGNLQDGLFSSKVSTIAVRAEFMLSTSWYEANPGAYGDLSTAVLRMGQQQGGMP